MTRVSTKKMISAAAAAAIACTLSSTAYADDDFKQKRSLKNNMMVVYNVLPEKADSFTNAFADGILYGRLRSNNFKWDWKNNDTATTGNKDNYAVGLGGSLIYKTAPLYGVSGTVGMYYTDNPFPGGRMAAQDIKYLKAGKDTTSRYNVSTDGNYGFATVAQANIQYDYSKTTFIAGRQIFESFLTKSNDTKMIPNTFEGYTLTTKELPKTRIRGAWFYKQKLRDHETFHDVLTFKDGNGNSWNNNDDAAVHKGLTYNNLKNNGKTVNNSLIVADLRNTSIKNLRVDVTYGAVPGIVSSLTGELNYKIPMGAWSLTPGARYMYQMDNGGGDIGGACLSGTLAVDKTPTSNLGYKDRFTLDSGLWMGRLTLKNGPLKLQAAYSAVDDKADIVAPWRGFPTGGYTRAMAQYNWRANTKTSCVEAAYDFDKAKMVSGLSAMVRYAMQDFDNAKQAAGGQADSNVIHIDVRETIKAVPGLYAKLRVGLVDADTRTNGVQKDSYNEYRFELNYMF